MKYPEWSRREAFSTLDLGDASVMVAENEGGQEWEFRVRVGTFRLPTMSVSYLTIPDRDAAERYAEDLVGELAKKYASAGQKLHSLARETKRGRIERERKVPA